MINWIVPVASAGLLQGALEFFRFVFTAALLRTSFPLSAMRGWLIAARALSAMAVTLFVASFGLNPWFSPAVSLVVTVGGELKSHLALRTTAAYSTSDGQNQRLFNLSVVFILLGVCAAAVVSYFGRNPFPHRLSAGILQQSREWPGAMILIGGAVIYILRARLFLTHYQTMVYIFKSYFRTWQEGKLKRFW
ncbi:MAG: hypothetical protein HY714_04655 [Candidatus Omnitrophica bacterium]|nr:hypothetical protein [Candidatus Omnitrophota bacterium]